MSIRHIRVVVADDHPVVRDGLVAILGTQPDFEVVATAGNGVEVVDVVASLRPDVLLLDLEMPQMDGVEALKALRVRDISVRVIVFTAFDTDERILGAVQAGAEGYLLKGAPREELFEAIRIVNGGGSLLQPLVMSKLLRHISQQENVKAVEPLSPREREVLQLMARGLQNKEIAATLIISERTVKFHVSSILGKLGAGNRTEAVTMALQQGIIEQ
jgi:DNA-binding NarL/FixJ family response regulator